MKGTKMSPVQKVVSRAVWRAFLTAAMKAECWVAYLVGLKVETMVL
jgi:hypothetical protein